MSKDAVRNRNAGSDLNQGTYRIAEFSFPEEVRIVSAKGVHFFAVGNGKRKIIQIAFKVVWFVADDISIKKGSINHFSVVESGDRDHDRVIGIGVTFSRNVPLENPEIRERVMLMLQIKWRFGGNQKVRSIALPQQFLEVEP